MQISQLLRHSPLRYNHKEVELTRLPHNDTDAAVSNEPKNTHLLDYLIVGLDDKAPYRMRMRRGDDNDTL